MRCRSAPFANLVSSWTTCRSGLMIEDTPQLQDIADEIACLYRNASRGLCPDCGSYEECPCNERAHWIATGGY